MQVSEAGIHRPPVGGIAGTEKEGCQSLVISGGYEDDVDDGEEFTYTGEFTGLLYICLYNYGLYICIIIDCISV